MPLNLLSTNHWKKKIFMPVDFHYKLSSWKWKTTKWVYLRQLSTNIIGELLISIEVLQDQIGEFWRKLVLKQPYNDSSWWLRPKVLTHTEPGTTLPRLHLEFWQIANSSCWYVIQARYERYMQTIVISTVKNYRMLKWCIWCMSNLIYIRFETSK